MKQERGLTEVACVQAYSKNNNPLERGLHKRLAQRRMKRRLHPAMGMHRLTNPSPGAPVQPSGSGYIQPGVGAAVHHGACAGRAGGHRPTGSCPTRQSIRPDG